MPEYGSNDFTRAFYKYSLYASGGGGADDWGSNATRSTKLNVDSVYKGHTNDSGMNNPNHHVVETWMKFK